MLREPKLSMYYGFEFLAVLTHYRHLRLAYDHWLFCWPIRLISLYSR